MLLHEWQIFSSAKRCVKFLSRYFNKIAPSPLLKVGRVTFGKNLGTSFGVVT